MYKLVKLAILGLAALGANSIYSNYRETQLEKSQSNQPDDQPTSYVTSV